MTAFVDGRVEADPYPNYAWLRAHQPVCPLPSAEGEPASWMLTRYADVRAALMDPRLSSDRRNRSAAPAADQAGQTATDHGNALVGLDPPRHTALRRIVAGAFQARRVEAMRARCAARAHELIDAFAGHGRADLVQEYTVPYAGLVVAEFLGVPEDLLDLLCDWSQLVVDAAARQEEVDPGDVAAVEEYLAELLRAKRAEPGDDVLTDLVRAADEQGALTDLELAAMTYVILSAGHIPTLHYLGGILFRVLGDPRLRAIAVAHGPARREALEELARLDSASQLLTTRYALEDLEICGRRIAAGESVVLSVAAANRDADRFPDADQAIERGRVEHLAFGHGPHFCLGAPLARIEAEETLSALLARLPDLRLAAAPDSLSWHGGPYRRGPSSLPAAFTARPPGRAAYPRSPETRAPRTTIHGSEDDDC
jgi:cytochrome P450